jgi:ABC-type spermidine/putrescine transport system permease subunit II
MFGFDNTIVLCALSALVAGFIGWLTGLGMGREDERKRNYALQREKESKNIYFL